MYMLRQCCGLVCLAAGWLAMPASAAMYPLPKSGDLIGSVQYVITKPEDTLIEIARRYDLGFNEIKAANPAIDPWLPKGGEQVVVPTRFILPRGARQGIVINLAEMRLYYFPRPVSGQQAMVITYPIGIGRVGWSTPEGEYKVINKIENPTWKMPDSVIEEWVAEGRTPRKFVPPGPDNPLGEYAMGLSLDGYYIHGTNKAFSVGMRVSHGCLRLYPEDIASLFQQVERNETVRIVNEPYKFGRENGVNYLEAHAPLEDFDEWRRGTAWLSDQLLKQMDVANALSWERVQAIHAANNGVPIPFSGVGAEKAGSLWYLQVGAFNATEGAMSLQRRLRDELSLPVEVAHAETGQLTRVLVGPAESRNLLFAYAALVKYAMGIEGMVRDSAPSL